MIEFVYFDLGNVLWSFDESRACQNVADLFGCSAQDAQEAIYGGGLQSKFEHGLISPSGFAKTLRVKLATNGDAPMESSIADQAILDAVSDMFDPIESMVDVITAVGDSGVKIGILSNTCHAHWNWIDHQAHPLMRKPFDAIVLSFEVNSMKPEDQIYRAAELACGVDSEKILFLDDKAENVSAAQLRGWNAVQCTGGESARVALQHYKVIA